MSGIEPDVDSETSSQETSSSVSQDGRNTKNETFASEATVSSSDDADLETLVSEDHPLLTRKERWGWYLYDGANSVFLRYVAGRRAGHFIASAPFFCVVLRADRIFLSALLNRYNLFE